MKRRGWEENKRVRRVPAAALPPLNVRKTISVGFRRVTPTHPSGHHSRLTPARAVQPVELLLPVRPKPYVPSSLSELQFGRFLGRGKFARVCVATTGDWQYAAKRMLTEGQKYAEVEWGILQQLQHPFLVQGYAHFLEENTACILLEYIEGSDLFKVKRTQRLRLGAVVFVLAEVVCALSYLHSRQIIYRDLKPENIMVDVDGHIRLIDFDLSKRLETGRTATMCGSPEYMAPEMLTKRGYGLCSDWWALGILAYELLCGY